MRGNTAIEYNFNLYIKGTFQVPLVPFIYRFDCNCVELQYSPSYKATLTIGQSAYQARFQIFGA
jgi:hypothetical protein